MSLLENGSLPPLSSQLREMTYLVDQSSYPISAYPAFYFYHYRQGRCS